MSEPREFFADMAARAQRYGLRPGFATAKYKEEFGDWPPRSWSDAVLRAFADDPSWQARAEYRRKERAHYEEWEEKVQPIALARKAAWIEKHKNDPKRITGALDGEVGSLVGVHKSGKRGRPIHGFEIGKDATLCGQSASGWTTERRPFRTSTEFGCKKCKKILAQRDQLTMRTA